MLYTLLVDIYDSLLMDDRRKLIMSDNELLNEILKYDIQKRYRIWLSDNCPLLDWRNYDNTIIQLINRYELLGQPRRLIMTVYSGNDNSLLIMACKYKSRKVALKMIKTFGESCIPQQINSLGQTALSICCGDKFENVAIKLIETFGKLCVPPETYDRVLYIATTNRLSKVVNLLEKLYGHDDNL